MSSSSYGTAAREAGDLPLQPYDLSTNEPPNVATLTSISASGTSAVALAANVGRKGATFNNGGSTTCYLAFAPTASATVFTVLIIANASYTLANPVYNGIVSAIWAGSPSGSLQVTQF